jgi:hypothetical protein
MGLLRRISCFIGFHGSCRLTEKLFSINEGNPDDNRLEGYVYQCERCERTFVSLPQADSVASSKPNVRERPFAQILERGVNPDA